MSMNFDTLFNELLYIYSGVYGNEPQSVSRLPVSGGNRVYYRLSSAAGECIGTIGESEKENERFIEFSRILADSGVNVPSVLAVGNSGKTYLQEDLGSSSLFDMVMSERKKISELTADPLSGELSDGFTPDSALRDLIIASMTQLVKAQKSLKNHLHTDFRRQIMWDLNYFKYEFLKVAGIEFDENAFENDFDCLADWIMGIPKEFQGFLYRDFQSRNVMVKDNLPYLIDYQGGMSGPVLYDAISFMYQAKAGFSEPFRREMLRNYCLAYIKTLDHTADPEEMLEGVLPLSLLRTLQVLGAYGFRGLIERRAHFIESIKGGLRNLELLTADSFCDNFPELKRVCRALIDSPKFADATIPGLLTVEVCSFSYKKGYPENLTGNGGGFMFDCRAMHNPGRYDEYKPLTGLDKPVIDFLEEKSEVQTFLKSAESLVIPAVDRYSKRKFTHLQIGFGCTGGQHRSVYCAEHLAQSLKKRFPDVVVRVIHRERGINRVL